MLRAVVTLVALLVAGMATLPALAQGAGKASFTGLWVATDYPAQSIGADKSVDLPITVHNAGLPPQVVQLTLTEAADGWAPVLLGDGRPVKSVFVGPDSDAQVTLRLTPSKDTETGTYDFLLAAKSSADSFELPIHIAVGEVIPADLVLETELPALRGTPTSKFDYQMTLRNPSGTDVTAVLEAEAPPGFQVSFKERYGSQELTSLPVKAGDSRDLSVNVDPPPRIEAGDYQVAVHAIAPKSNASQVLKMELTGRPELKLTGLGERLSGDARAGEETSIDLVLSNQGSAPARAIELGSFEPSGWKIAFVPNAVDLLAPGAEQKIEALITPSSEAIAGDYQVTLRANGDGASQSTDYRVTVRTSTLWGVAGILVIAAALGVLTLAIVRYGRR
ncbi:MAG: NEW3 domain-containing protein [Kiloniellales bacterium]